MKGGPAIAYDDQFLEGTAGESFGKWLKPAFDQSLQKRRPALGISVLNRALGATQDEQDGTFGRETLWTCGRQCPGCVGESRRAFDQDVIGVDLRKTRRGLGRGKTRTPKPDAIDTKPGALATMATDQGLV